LRVLMSIAVLAFTAVACDPPKSPPKEGPQLPQPGGAFVIEAQDPGPMVAAAEVVVRCYWQGNPALNVTYTIEPGSLIGIADLGIGTVCDIETDPSRWVADPNHVTIAPSTTKVILRYVG